MSEQNGNPPPRNLDGSVTIWLQAMIAGDSDAVSRLWERYHGRLLQLARKRLQGLGSRAVGGEDVALSAFTRFCRAAETGRLKESCNRDDRWRLLLKITLDRAVDTHRRETAQIRGGGQVVSVETEDTAGRLPDLVDGQPSPEMGTILADEYARLMAALEQDDLRGIAELRLDGFTNKEIGARLGLAERTIERRLKLIRRIWTEHGYHD